MEEIPKPKGKPGRRVGFRPPRKLVFNEKLLNQVETMRAMGLTQLEIASMLGVSDQSMTTYRQENPALDLALRNGRTKANLKVAETAFNMAKNGKNSSMTQFWLRTQAGWKDTIEIKTESKVTVVFEAEVIGGTIRTTERSLPIGDAQIIDAIIDNMTEALCPSKESESE